MKVNRARRMITIAAAVGLACTALAGPRAGAESLEDRLGATVETWRTAHEGHAVSVSVRVPGRGIAWDDAAGDVRQYWPASADTLYRIGSATKTFTATMILQLADEERLSLDDPLAKWYPQYPGAAYITVRNLLQHTSGIKEMQLEDAWFILISFLQSWRIWRPEEMIAWSASPLPMLSLRTGKLVDRTPDPAGTVWRYAQPNYILLGRILEKVTGRSYARNLRARIAGPLGLAHTRLPATGDDPFMPAWSNLFGLFPILLPTTIVASYNSASSAAWSAGGIVTTTRDLVRFHEAVETGELVSPRAFEEMHTTFVEDPAHPGRDGYGLGLSRSTLGSHTTWGHDGGIPGFVTVNRFEAACGVYLVVASNADDDPAPDPGATPAPDARHLDQLGATLLDTVDDGIGCPS
ncbi:MAG: serine hydrolase domain-containing protein [Acidimicrobiia bacterium]